MRWIGTSRYVYNKSLNYVKTNGNNELNFFQLRNKFVTAKNNPEVQEWQKETPKDIRAGAIRDMVKAYKTSFSNLKAGNIHKFNLGYRSKKKNNSIEIPKSSIKFKDGQLSLYNTYLGSTIKVSKDKSLTNLEIKHDCRLRNVRGEWYLIVPVNVSGNEKVPPLDVCALDPGVRKFQTLYSEYKIQKIMIKKELIAKLQSKLDLFRSLKNRKLISKQSYKRRERKIYNKLDNLIDDLHYKTICNITNDYKLIFLPIFETQEIVKKNKFGNRDLLQLKHYLFRTRFQNKCNLLKNTKVIICTEEFTSKTCSRCGKVNYIGAAEVFRCSECKLKADRDINASRNIFIKCTSEHS